MFRMCFSLRLLHASGSGGLGRADAESFFQLPADSAVILIHRAAPFDPCVQHFKAGLQLGSLAEFFNQFRLGAIGPGRHEFKLRLPCAVGGQSCCQLLTSAFKLKQLGFSLGGEA